jgi:hypothetical protein
LEVQFKNAKARGELMPIAYGRKRPYPRASANRPVLKLQDLGKIRYAWYHDPRIPISDPARLFELPEDHGLYGFAFGSEGELVDVWSDEQFRECLLAVHTYNKMIEALNKLQSEHDDLRQISRLRYYGLKLFKIYFDEMSKVIPVSELQQIYLFGSGYNTFFERASKIICRTLMQAYREILKREEGTAFSLPRDQKVWDLVKTKFEENLALIRDLS